jgi:tight adherence protein C
VSDSSLLTGGTALVFVGLLLAAALGLRSSSEPTGVARSLLIIERLHPDARSSGSQLPAGDRLLRPAVRRLGRLGLRLTPVGTPARLQRRLDLAGNPRSWTVERVLAAKAAGLVVGLAFGGLMLTSVGALMGLLWLAGAAAAGFWVGDVLLYNSGLKRQQALSRSLPDALDMLTVCVEAGLGFDAGLAQVARNTTGPIAGELARMLREMQIGKTRVTAFQDLAARTTVPELQILVSALVQSDRLGIPLANVLREQSTQMRLKRRQRAEEQAQKVPVKILFPLVLCIFPSLFVVIIGPGAIQIAHTMTSMSCRTT